MLAGDLGRRTGRSQSYPRSSLGVPRQVLTHGAVNLTFSGGQMFRVPPLAYLGESVQPSDEPIEALLLDEKSLSLLSS